MIINYKSEFDKWGHTAIMNEISEKLTAIEKANNVRIIYACESGSRAWGFESVNSDYDVRFIYVDTKDNYLSVERKYGQTRDVIEDMDGDLDMAGWDLAKTLWLMGKSNPPLFEWLNSPMKYRVEEPAFSILIDASLQCFTKERCFVHYLHMARGNYKEYLKSDEVRMKKYLYVLRPLLACEWLVKKNSQIPVRFDVMVNEFMTGELKDAVDDLVRKKKSGQELGKMKKIKVINDYIDRSIESMNALEKGFDIPFIDASVLDKAFLDILNER